MRDSLSTTYTLHRVAADQVPKSRQNTPLGLVCRPLDLIGIQAEPAKSFSSKTDHFVRLSCAS